MRSTVRRPMYYGLGTQSLIIILTRNFLTEEQPSDARWGYLKQQRIMTRIMDVRETTFSLGQSAEETSGQ